MTPIIYCKYDKLIPIEDFIPHELNTNRHPEEQIEVLAKLMAIHGIRHPIIISSLSNKCVAGHGRYEAIRLLGLEKIPVVYQNFNSHLEEYKFLESDNYIAEFSDHDTKKMLANLKELKVVIPDFDFEEIGLIDFDIPNCGTDGEDNEKDDLPSIPDHPITELGDVWVLGDHRIACGDSKDIDLIDCLTLDNKADMILTDPPYNLVENDVGYKDQDLRTDRSDSYKDLKESSWDKSFKIEDYLPIMVDILKKDASMYIFTSQFLINKIWEYLYEAKFEHVAYNVWAKPNPMPSLNKRHWTWNQELCVHATRGKHIFNFPKEGHAPSTWSFTKKTDGTHPTQKPVDLLTHIISHSSKKNDLIIDLFLGSGSTLIASEILGRFCYGVEIDPVYCDITIKRWQGETGKEAILESTGETYNYKQNRINGI